MFACPLFSSSFSRVVLAAAVAVVVTAPAVAAPLTMFNEGTVTRSPDDLTLRQFDPSLGRLLSVDLLGRIDVNTVLRLGFVCDAVPGAQPGERCSGSMTSTQRAKLSYKPDPSLFDLVISKLVTMPCVGIVGQSTECMAEVQFKDELSVGLSGTDINGFIGTGSFVMDILTLPIFAGSIYSRVTYTYEATDPTTVVPEPASLALVGLGLVVAVATRRRRPGCAVAGSSPTRAHDLAVAG